MQYIDDDGDRMRRIKEPGIVEEERQSTRAIAHKSIANLR